MTTGTKQKPEVTVSGEGHSVEECYQDSVSKRHRDSDVLNWHAAEIAYREAHKLEPVTLASATTFERATRLRNLRWGTTMPTKTGR